MFLSTESYKVFIEKPDFKYLQEFFSKECKQRELFVLMDENTEKHCFPIIQSFLNGSFPVSTHVIRAGESFKTLETAQGIWRFLLANNARRNALVVNLGGGVVTDIGGFAASTFKRGIDFINVPTSLMGQIDAALGGKTAVDFDGLKNVIGTFNNPKAVFVYEGFLKTLDTRELKAGFAEALKHALIDNRGYWSYLKDFDFEGYERMIFKSLEIKKKIVERDPKERAERKLLNFGHTIGHAIETLYLEKKPQPILHGEAVAAGMIAEAWISWKLNKINDDDLNEITTTIRSFFAMLPIASQDIQFMIEVMENDKKKTDNRLNFTLLEEIGEGVINQCVDEQLIRPALEYYLTH